MTVFVIGIANDYIALNCLGSQGAGENCNNLRKFSSFLRKYSIPIFAFTLKRSSQHWLNLFHIYFMQSRRSTGTSLSQKNPSRLAKKGSIAEISVFNAQGYMSCRFPFPILRKNGNTIFLFLRLYSSFFPLFYLFFAFSSR